MANKKKMDDKAWRARKDMKNPCSNAAINQKDFETLNKSSRQTESRASGSRPASTRNNHRTALMESARSASANDISMLAAAAERKA